MTKSERLLKIVRLFRRQHKISLDELSRTCDISKRTVYRDILTLKQLDFEICFDDGYFLDGQTIFPELKLDDEEAELLGFCLNYTPLHQSPHFRRKLAEIERKIIRNANFGKCHKLGRHLVGFTSDNNHITAEQDRVLQGFVDALLRHKLISAHLKPSGKEFDGLKAAGLLIENSAWNLVMSDKVGKKMVKIPLDKVAKLVLSD